MNLFKNYFGLLLIPVAIIIGVLSLFPFHWLLYFTLVKGRVISGVDVSEIERLFTPFVFVFFYVYTGFKIPKTYKFHNAGILFGIYFLLMVGFIITGLFKDEVYGIPLGFSWVTFLGLIGGILALIVSYKLDGGASFQDASPPEDDKAYQNYKYDLRVVREYGDITVETGKNNKPLLESDLEYSLGEINSSFERLINSPYLTDVELKDKITGLHGTFLFTFITQIIDSDNLTD